jgi:pyruvate carboxylase
VTTNIAFLKAVLEHPAFRAGEITTHFIDEHLSDWCVRKEQLPAEVLAAVAISDYISNHSRPEQAADGAGGNGAVVDDPHSPWKKGGKWRISKSFAKPLEDDTGGGE